MGRWRHAIENDDFVLVYQPQLHLNSGRLRGFEALLRWQHRVAGTVAPNVFIPLLEETRLINRLGEWIFREGARQLAAFKQHFGEDMVLSLNVSPVQFGMPQLVKDLQRVLDFHGLKPSQLEVEVTESALMQDLELAQAQLRHLRELGVKIAIDDFGTGYSSLAYLRHFELDTLKIDRLFVSNMLDSPRDAAVVSTIIDLGHHLGLEVIVRGRRNSGAARVADATPLQHHTGLSGGAGCVGRHRDAGAGAAGLEQVAPAT